MTARLTLLAFGAAALLLGGCASPATTPSEPSSPSPAPSTTATAADCTPNPDIPTPDPAVAYDEPLHDELVAMLDRDQAERTGQAETIEGDEVRTERLKQIIADRGWPIIPMVGEDGEDAAWAIAQHSDFDPQFQ